MTLVIWFLKIILPGDFFRNTFLSDIICFGELILAPTQVSLIMYIDYVFHWSIMQYWNIRRLPRWHGQTFRITGARLTKAYDVTIHRCRKSHAKIEDSKMHILWCMGSKFCVKFQRCPLKFHTQFWTHTPQNMHFMRCWKFGDLWYLKSYDI